MNHFNKLSIHTVPDIKVLNYNHKQKTRFKSIRNYPENTDVIVNYVYDSKYPASRGQAITDSRTVNIVVQHSLIKMPDDNYSPRFDDTRVGYFTTQTNNMTSLDQVNYRDFINRWRLEKNISRKITFRTC